MCRAEGETVTARAYRKSCAMLYLPSHRGASHRGNGSMPEYRHDAAAIRALVRDDAVHRDVYISGELFDLEMERLWRSAWTYVGHDSQVPNSGDFCTVNIAGQPLLMLRGADGAVRVLLNRCAHKGAKILSANSGNCGKLLRCSYHGWTYTLDGSLRTVPVKSGYAETRFAESHRQPGGPLAGRPSRSGGSPLALHAQQQLEDVRGESQRHHASHGGARVLRGDRAEAMAGPAAGRAQADGDRAIPALRLGLRVFRQDGRQDLRQRSQLYRRQFFDSLELCGDSGICRADGGGLRRRAGAGHTRGVPAQYRLLSEPDDQ